MSDSPLPEGWIKQHDPHYNHSYWVDTRANPPRAIWVHPYEDEQFLKEHPKVKALKEANPESDLDAPPPYDAATEGQASGSGEKSGTLRHSDIPDPATSGTSPKRGVFGKLKDRAIGTKEEREELKRIRAEQVARAEERARQARLRELEEREAYMRAYGGYAPYHPGYAARPVNGQGAGLGGEGALLLGGLAGGLLLGDIFSGGF